MVGDGVGQQDHHHHDDQLHISASLSCVGADGIDHAAQHQEDITQAADAGGSLETAEHVGHPDDADHAHEGEERAEHQQDINNHSQSHIHSLPSR